MPFRDKLNTSGTLATPPQAGVQPTNLGNAFSVLQSQSGAAITNFSFSGLVRSFEASVSVIINAATPVADVFTLYGINDGTHWYLSSTSVGTDTGIAFSIDDTGQVLYTSGTWPGFTSGVLYYTYSLTTPR